MRLTIIAAALLLGPRATASAASPYEWSATKRVIEEELVVMDPTVAGKSKWLLGASLEGWHISQKVDTVDQQDNPLSSGRTSGNLSGGGIVIGYSNLTFQYAHRKGRVTGTTTQSLTNRPFETRDVGVQTEDEATLRYLFRLDNHFNPYLIAGYNRISFAESADITTPNRFYTGGTTHDATVMIHSSALIGIGLVFAVNRHFGVRGDGRVLISSFRYWDSTLGAAGGNGTGHGVGSAVTATAYVNLIQGFNLQVGGKFQGLPGPSGPTRVRWGSFATLGYSFKF